MRTVLTLNARPNLGGSPFGRLSYSPFTVTSRDGGMIPDELHGRLLRRLQEDPTCSQRELARALGISLGGTNQAVQALLERGLDREARNFTRGDHQRGYLYRLTPDGLSQKARLADRLLQRKRAEHQALLADIEQLRAEVQAAQPGTCERGLPQNLEPGSQALRLPTLISTG
jgi:EPS-associated MarR family transcriptional regulator